MNTLPNRRCLITYSTMQSFGIDSPLNEGYIEVIQLVHK